MICRFAVERTDVEPAEVGEGRSGINDARDDGGYGQKRAEELHCLWETLICTLTVVFLWEEARSREVEKV